MVFTDNELLVYKQNGKTYSGGFTVNSLMMQHGISPIIGGGGGSGGSTKTEGPLHDTFHNLAIPAGLYYFDGGLEQKGGAKNATYVNEEEYVSDELYSRLMELAGNVQGSTNTNEEPDKKGGKEGKHKRTKKQRLLQENKKRKTKKH